jgi:NADPH:quinone reductase-like Zn-dependent oxidoreductase
MTTNINVNTNMMGYVSFYSSLGEIPLLTYPSSRLIIKNQVVAINPVDWKVQSPTSSFNLTYPAVPGEDVAGELLEVGSKLEDRFHVGQRVMAHTTGLSKGPAYGGFQLYPILTAAITSPIPDNTTFSEAAVLPLSISTAAAGLFMKATLGLDYPATKLGSSIRHLAKDAPALLLWGGSSSVGASVIQLASAAGYSVITTASPSNFQLCKDLGATHVLDYHNPDIRTNLIRVLKDKKVVGAYDAIGSNETVHQSASVLDALGGGKIASVGTVPDDLPSSVTITRIGAGNIITVEPEVAEEIWGKYVPWALKNGRLVPSPKELVVGKGLKNVQKGLDRQKEGVSARKVEVILG